eukprot:TRINITY_DN5217_c0_g1_i1.p1 TRINITY_DN5217_c0_g1~~TRINITY_DN5217_c0_g1_i1.p1  ORF type:complete len:290 (+),score=74.97 TRINITY_DN5217_c0_g1_i1:25-870(+)
MARVVCLVLLLALLQTALCITCPFTRELTVQTPPLTGDDVTVLQALLARTQALKQTGAYDAQTAAAVSAFQKANRITPSGNLDDATSDALISSNANMDDGYKDDGTIPAGFLYKMHVPVYHNRSVETTGTLTWHNGTVLHRFTVRTEGQPYANTTIAANQFCDSGSTPTGLMTFDLNSPEDDPVSFGPYPVNRAVQGLKGNAGVVISDIRDGILMHTGEWQGWNPSLPMPNSHGCVHGHPTDIEYVWKVLVSLGIEVRQNTDGKLPYPYKPQGILSIELMD